MERREGREKEQEEKEENMEIGGKQGGGKSPAEAWASRDKWLQKLRTSLTRGRKKRQDSKRWCS